MAWYDTGTVSVTNGSTTVTGSGTNFVAGVQVGEGFSGPDGRIYEIQGVVSATALTLADPYLGATQSGQSYKIVPTQSLVAALATQVSTLISDFQGVVDEAGSGKFDDGTAASAGITFTLDQDTGIFRPAANQIGFTTAGVQRAKITNTGIDVTGTVTADGLTVDGNGLFQGITGAATVNLVSTQNLANAGQKIAFFGANRSETDEEMAYIQGLLTDNNVGAGNVQSGHLAFGTSGTERMRIDASGHAIIPAGVTLGTAAGVYSEANTLDDYEEGTWTPVISDGTNNATSNIAVGSYTKTGNHVHVQGRVRLSSLDLVTGALEMTGLPFTSQSLTNNFCAMTIGRAIGLNLVAGTALVGDLRSTVTSVKLLVFDASLGNTGIQDTEFTATGDISFSMDYLAN